LLLALDLRLWRSLLLRGLAPVPAATIPAAATTFTATAASIAAIFVGALLRACHRWQRHGCGSQRQEGSRLE
jgi:hypothetical protein